MSRPALIVITLVGIILAGCRNPYRDAILDVDMSTVNDISEEVVQLPPDEGVLSGSEATIYVRFKLVEVPENGFLLAKDGNYRSRAYRMMVASSGDSCWVNVSVGSDEIAGVHELNHFFSKKDIGKMQDVVFRFDGKVSQLYVNGILRDDEVTVGTLRDWNHRPVVIGRDYPGRIDHVVLWNRALTDGEIARISSVVRLKEGLPDYYHETYRPQYHFTAKKHWINDPNGLVWYDGVYHMFFQYYPPERPGSYKDWGHAVSTDLVHWTQTKEGHITPHRVWAGCWSGSAVVDENNVSGLQTGDEKPILAFITTGGWPDEGLGPMCNQCIAFSNDGGKSFRYYDGNPVICTRGIESPWNRDPKVVWDEEHQLWVLSLYLTGYQFAIYTSKNLLDWEEVSTLILAGDRECPGFMPLPVDGVQQGKWLFYGAAGVYQIGTFDGKTFTPETEPVAMDHGNNLYAAQTWNNSPDGRCIHLGWMRGPKYPGVPFDQQMNFPTVMELRTTSDGIRVFRNPVEEIKLLYVGQTTLEEQKVASGSNLLDALDGDLYDMTFVTDAADSFDLEIRGAKIRYDAASRTIYSEGPVVGGKVESLGSAHLRLADGTLTLRILVDRTSLEIFADGGETVITSNFMPEPDNHAYALIPVTHIHLLRAEINTLKSSWE